MSLYQADALPVPFTADGSAALPALGPQDFAALWSPSAVAASWSGEDRGQADPFAADLFAAVPLEPAAALVKLAEDGADALTGTSAFACADDCAENGLPSAADGVVGVALTAAAVADRAGNTLARARDIGSLSGTQTFSDWVGLTDTNDYYRFQLGQAGTLSLTLNGLRADADLQLLSSTGGLLASSVNGGASADSITRALGAGTYYARVYRFSGNTNYNLTLTATLAAPAPAPAFSAVNGYGEASVERAIERLLNISIPDLPAQFSGGLYGLDRIGAPEAWSAGYNGQGMVVAVLDTGVDRGHQDLDANIWTNAREIAGNGVDDDGNGFVDDVFGWNFDGNNSNTLDGHGHGTHVSGTIAAERNGFGVTGVAYGARVMPVKVLSDTGSGSYASVANGIRYAADNGANVINLSLGGGTGDLAVRSAIEYAWSRGLAVVMAAGNEGAATTGYPAAYASSWGIAVGAVDSAGSMASFSNRAGTTVLDYVTAAGVAVTSTTPNNTYATWSGTSMATPHMAGAMALLMQANRASGRNLSIGQLEQIMTATATNAIAAAAGATGVASTGLAARSIQMADGADPAPGTESAEGTKSAGLSAWAPSIQSEPSAGAAAVRDAVFASPASQGGAPFELFPNAAAGPPLASSPSGGVHQDLLLSPWERSGGGDDSPLDLLTGLPRRIR